MSRDTDRIGVVSQRPELNLTHPCVHRKASSAVVGGVSDDGSLPGGEAWLNNVRRVAGGLARSGNGSPRPPCVPPRGGGRHEGTDPPVSPLDKGGGAARSRGRDGPSPRPSPRGRGSECEATMPKDETSKSQNAETSRRRDAEAPGPLCVSPCEGARVTNGFFPLLARSGASLPRPGTAFSFSLPPGRGALPRPNPFYDQGREAGRQARRHRGTEGPRQGGRHEGTEARRHGGTLDASRKGQAPARSKLHVLRERAGRERSRLAPAALTKLLPRDPRGRLTGGAEFRDEARAPQLLKRSDRR